MKRRMEKMCVWVLIIALVVLMGACGKTASGDEQPFPPGRTRSNWSQTIHLYNLIRVIHRIKYSFSTLPV
ncbi:MAG: hypothetical protein GX115_11300 [Ruminiclostridium sp.]|nr:hypothetical protein [Ruminiclostridium sp.]